MHGHSLESVLLLNAEVDSMGGVIDGGVGIDTKASPRRAAIEKAQAELRQEYDAREERRKELEFLEKGGNPLNFKLGTAASVSFQSTSFTDQIVNSEAKGSFSLAASPPGDSAESSGRPGISQGRETNTADNLLLFDVENDRIGGKRTSTKVNRCKDPVSKKLPKLDGLHCVKQPDDLVSRLEVIGQYTRRNRSRASRDARACPTELASACDRKGSSVLPSSRHGSRNVKGLASEAITQKNHCISFICNSKSATRNGVVLKTADSDNKLDIPHAEENNIDLKDGVLKCEFSGTTPKDFHGSQHNKVLHGAADQVPDITNSVSLELVGETTNLVSGLDCGKVGNLDTASGPNQFSFPDGVGKDLANEGKTNTIICNRNSLEPESSSTQATPRLDANISTEQTPLSKINSSKNYKEQRPEGEESIDIPVVNVAKENSETKDVGIFDNTEDVHNPVEQDLKVRESSCRLEEEICDKKLGLKDEVELVPDMERGDANESNCSKPKRKLNHPSGDESINGRPTSFVEGRQKSTSASSQCKLMEATFSGRGSEASPQLNSCTGSHIKLANKVHEDSVLEEARIIEAKRKRIAELSEGSFPLENRRKSHWDFVLEEMAWLANDFMQERLWKTTIAAQICRMVAVNGRSRFGQQSLFRVQKKVAHTLAKAIMQFWHSAELLSSDDPSLVLKDCKVALVESLKVNGGESVKSRIEEPHMQESSKHNEENPAKSLPHAIQGYAVRFLKYSNTLGHADQAEAPLTPDRISDLGIIEWDDQLSEETLFYTVPLGAMEGYRKSVELHWSQYQKSASSMHQEEVDSSIYYAGAEFESRENAYGEYVGETGTYYLPGAFEGSRLSNFAQKKRKNPSKSYSARSYEIGPDLSYGHCAENKMGPHPSFLVGKRPSNNINVGSIPTKRVRTAARQRVVSPFGAGTAGGVQFPNKTDASSGDTSSFQDDQSTVHGGSQVRKSLEVASTGEFGKHFQPDYTEISMKPKKNKPKHSLHKNSINSQNSGTSFVGKGSAYEQRWPLDSVVQNEQRDHSKKRLESHAFESNGNGGFGGPHISKKLKIMKQLTDTSESINPLMGSIPSPVASQISNMSNPNKLVKSYAGRDRGRKTKVLKIPTGQLGSESKWSHIEDQALVVLVHDMGPNWELVSDVINSTIKFKCVFRKPEDCKERHKNLMDKNAGDGADSAEDSGSSQPYPSTLPGIPKGGARQLFQRLQGPMEEDTLKFHLEKIIFVGQHQYSRRRQNDNQDQKQIPIVPVHNSHVIAMSQVCPDNLNGGCLTPLNLCDATTSSPDVISLGQGSQPSGLAISNHGSGTPVASSTLQGSSGMVLGNSLPSSSSSLNASSRDGHRFNGPRTPTLSIDEQQRMQHYNKMMSGRNVHHSVPGTLGGADRGVRMLPGGNGMGMMSGNMNRSMPMPRSGFQGIGSPMLNMVSSGNMLPTTGTGIPNSIHMQNGSVSSQGATMMRPRDSMHMFRPGQNPEDQRQQMMMQELQMQQVTQGSSQGLPAFNALSPGFSNQTAPPPGQTFSVQHPQQQHQMTHQQSHGISIPQQAHHPHLQGSNHSTTTPQQQAYMLRLAKEKQLHQRLMHHHHQQQHPFTTPNASIPHVQTQPQLPMPPLPNNSQIQQQASSLPSSSSPLNQITPQPQLKQHPPSHGLARGHQGSTGNNLANQIMKQRRQQQQLQQRQQSQPQQQAKLFKGMGKGNTIMHQNLTVDPSHVNGVSETTRANQVSFEKGEPVMQSVQGKQGPVSGSNPFQPSKSPMPSQSSNQSSPQQKLFSRSSSLSKQVPHISPAAVSSGHNTVSVSQQSHLPSTMSSAQQKQVGHSPHNVQRMLQSNLQSSSDSHMRSTVDQQPTNSTLYTGGIRAGPPEACTESSTSVTLVSSASGAPSNWESASEPVCDSGIPTTGSHMSAVGNPPPSTSTVEIVSEPSSSVQEISQKQLPGNLPTHPAPSAPLPQSPPPQEQKQLQSPQPQQQNPQAGNGELC